jgi:hypothetical protein
MSGEAAAAAGAAAGAKLPRRKLGATGLEVSILGFGASPLGSVFEVRPLCAGLRRWWGRAFGCFCHHPRALVVSDGENKRRTQHRHCGGNATAQPQPP